MPLRIVIVIELFGAKGIIKPGECDGERRAAAPPFRDAAGNVGDEARIPKGFGSQLRRCFDRDDNPGRRSITLRLSSEEAERKAKELARTQQEKLK